eukprot:UN00678
MLQSFLQMLVCFLRERKKRFQLVDGGKSLKKYKQQMSTFTSKSGKHFVSLRDSYDRSL